MSLAVVGGAHRDPLQRRSGRSAPAPLPWLRGGLEAGGMNPGLAAGLLFGIVFAALYLGWCLALREGGR